MTNRVWVRSGGKLKTIIESFTELRFTRRYNQLGDMLLRVPRVVDGAQFLVGALGDEISVVDDPDSAVPDLTFVIEHLEFTAGEAGLADDMIEVRGIEAGLLHARVALPPPHSLPLGSASHHTITGDTETAMRELVDNNCGPSAPAKRQYPGLVLATNQNRGVSKSYKARFEPLEEKLNAWAQVGDLGFEVQFDAANNEHVFTVLEGEDKSSKVEFSLRLDNAITQEWIESGSDQISLAYVAGQGTEEVRDFAAVWEGDEPEGKSRRELFVDARDLESESDLPTRGEEVLAERRIAESFQMEVDADGPFKYKTDWDLGDLVTVRNQAWDISKTKRVVQVETRLRGAEVDRKVVLGKAPRSLKRRVLDSIGDQATARSVLVEQGVHPEGRIVGIRSFGSSDSTESDDKGKLLEYTGSGSATLTINKNTHEKRDTFYAQQVGSGQLTIAAGSGVSLRFADSTLAAKTFEQGAMVTVIMVDDTTDAEVFALAGQLAFA